MDTTSPTRSDPRRPARDPSAALDVAWIHGSPSAKHNTDPDIQVHHYDADTVVLRQNMAVHYEAPFMFLLFGGLRAVLIDTGASASPEHFPLRTTVDDLVEQWLTANPRPAYELLVLHTHSHRDHVAGDGQFVGRPNTVLVDAGRAPSREYFGFDDDRPDDDQVARVDLGDRVVEVLPTPGHHEDAVTFYDARTGLLLTGDTVYPGRLYVRDWAAYRATIDRLVRFARSRPITHILGCHIEMTRQRGVDYPVRTTYQPDEPPLELPVTELDRIRAALEQVREPYSTHRFDTFVLVDNPG
jgi:glyoxylase-like metal-dependent hydrolase (beta-lactamase superfamily II)